MPITAAPFGTDMSDSESSTSSGRRIKVVRLLDEYDLTGVGDTLVQRWTASGEERMSLRDLADFFNQELLRTAMADAGMEPLAGEVENTYKLLTADDVSEADRTRTERRLEREGVDVEQLRRDFVTYQAIRTYLKDYRDASYAADDRDRTEVEKENIQRLRGRILTVTESKLDQLKRNEDLDIGDFRTFVDINVLCEDCGARYSIEELLERGECECGDEPDSS
jgi:DNA-binding transcriptional ArsR family regulator